MKHLKGRRLSFEDKRQIAKMLCAGTPPKEIAADTGVSLSAVSKIFHDFVIVTMKERYGDEPTQLSFWL